MAEVLIGTFSHPVDRTTASMRTAAMFIVIIGMDTFIVQPGFVQGLVDKGGFAEQQAGYIASAEMFGIAASTVAMIWLTSRARWRTLITAALIADAAGNLLCMGMSSFGEFIAIRFVVGMASGILISTGYAVIGLAQNPDRYFGLLITWVLVYGALGVFAMPSAFSRFGLKGVLVVLGLLAVSGLIAVRRLPNAAGPLNDAPSGPQRPLSLRVSAMVLAAAFCYFLSQGAVWPYLFLIGIAGGGGEQAVANGLSIAQFLGVAGAFTYATLGPHLRPSTSLIAGISASFLPMFYFLGVRSAVIYGVAVSIFNYAANYVTPLLMAVVARFDSSGRLIVYAVALQMLGLAIGPALGAAVIAPGNYREAVLISMGSCVACLVLILPPFYAHSREATVAGRV
jgi:predicted MFS family arabinose efflux permease